MRLRKGKRNAMTCTIRKHTYMEDTYSNQQRQMGTIDPKVRHKSHKICQQTNHK